MLAPKPHNLQSWLADIREPGMVTLYVDQRRLLPQTDPPNRQILIGCGAFLELLQMAAAQDGWRADIRLMPEGGYDAQAIDQRPFAVVRFESDPQVKRDPLFQSVRLRRTTRTPYEDRTPELAVLQSLQASAGRPGMTVFSSNAPDRVHRIGNLAIEGCRVEFTTPATWKDSVDLMRLGPDAVAAEPSGISVLGTGAWFARTFGLINPQDLLKTDGMAARYAVEDAIKAARATPAWLWLVSADNTRKAQIEAGRAYVRVALTATQLGLTLQPNSQVLQEFSEMRELYGAFHREVGVEQTARVQMLARVGYAPNAGPAPRRALAQIVRG